MKIISLQAENVKRLVAVDIRPDSNLVQITGKNGAGKTSVLDSIWWAMTGASHVQSTPIRKGQNKAKIRLDLGEIIVTRTFDKTDNGHTTGITVESADGARFPKPQAMLDSLLGELCFDPLAFSRRKPIEQFESLKRFVPDVDFAKIDGLDKRDRERRTEVNRLHKDAASAASMITIADGLPDDPIDITALVMQMTEAGRTNADIETRRARRESVKTEIERLLEGAASADDRAKEFANRRQAERIERVRKLEEQIEAENRGCAKAIDDNTALCATANAEAATKANDLQAKLNAAEALPEPVSLADIQGQIEAGRRINEQISKRDTRKAHLTTAEKYKAESDALTDAIDQRLKDRQEAIAAAKMPIEGLGFGDGEITLNGLPFDQASDAERLRTSVAIAIAQNPKLRVLRIRDGSLLDDDGLKLLESVCADNDFQCWIEQVDSSGKIGFVIAEGELVKAAE